MLSGRFPGGSALHPYGADQTPLEQRPTFRPEKLATEDGTSVRQYLVVETAFRSGQTVFVAGKVGPDGPLGAYQGAALAENACHCQCPRRRPTGDAIYALRADERPSYNDGKEEGPGCCNANIPHNETA